MLTCPNCGQDNPQGFRFCGACAAPLGGEQRATREERKVVTVLFCDLVGSTAQAERMDPEDVRALLSGYHERVRAELERFGGTVEKFIGDAVMALFGAPIAREDDPERAVRAALAVREALEGELSTRIGITTGEALVTLDARPERGEAMAAGDVVNTAARLQSAAPTDGILVDETTYRATERTIDYAGAPPVDAKGKAQPLAVWQAMQARSRFGVDVRQSAATELVGREREQTLLVETLARAKEERTPQLVTVVGVPGIGKSRLVWELFGHVDRGGELVTWRQGRSLPYGEGVSFWALAEIVKAQAGILDTDPDDEASAKLARAVASVLGDDGDAKWVERHLGPLVGLDTGAAGVSDSRDEAFAAWRRFVEALAEQRPLVLVFEDLHFADDGLLDFVEHLAGWTSGVPLLVLGTARPELLSRRPSWGGGTPNATTLSLSPLSDEETARVVHALLNQAVLPAELQQTLLERAGGNPLYAEEFARLLASGRQPSELPETVQGIVAARLDLVSPEEKRLLQDGSVLGKVFWLGALARMGGGERWTIEQRLHSLERHEFIRRERRASIAGEAEYAYRHILVRDVAYAQIPRSERVEKHRLAAEWIESLGRPDDHAEMLGHHYLAALDLAAATGEDTAGLVEPARTALRHAGDRAFALHAHPTAIRFYERAIEMWPRDDPERPELLLSYARSLTALDDARLDDALAAARDALVAAGSPARAAEASALLSESWWHRGQRERAHEHLEHARRLVDPEPPSPSKALVLSQLSRYSMLAGDADSAIDFGRQAVAMAESFGLDEVRAHALNNIGCARVHGGDDGGLADLERSIELALSINSAEAARGYNNLAAQVARLGDIERYWKLLRESVRAGERLGNPRVAGFAATQLVWAHLDDGEWDAFVNEAQRFVEESQRRGGMYHDADFVVDLAWVAMARGEDADARAGARRALELAREVAEPQTLAPVLSVVAEIELALGRREAAREYALEAIAQAALARPQAVTRLGLVADDLGIERELRATADAEVEGVAWAATLRALLDGDFVRAADQFLERRRRQDEASARMCAAEQLRAEGRHPEADEQLERALAFWRSVGATRFVRRCEALRRPPASQPLSA